MRKPNRQIQKTIDLTTGIVGLQVAGAVGATLPGLPGTIVNQGVMPIAATSLMGLAAGESPRRRRKRK